MKIEDTATYNEIVTQTKAWEQAIEKTLAADLPEAERYHQVLFTGCGSTYYLSLAAAALYQELTGRLARAVPGSELLLNSQTVLPARDEHKGANLLVAISRSGTTTETLKAVQKFKKDNQGDVVTISNYDEALSRLGDYNIVIPAGQEASVAQTRSFASLYVSVTAFCARLAKRTDLLNALPLLPKVGTRLMRDYAGKAREIGEDLSLDRFYFLGSGARYGLACEVNLKMKEMTLTHSEPFHFLEFRHGPMSMVNEKAVVIGLLSMSNYEHEAAVLKEMKNLGGKVVSLGEADADISFQSQCPEQIRGVLYLPILQLMACYRSLAKDLNPDRPTNLTAVVKLNL